MREGTRRKIAVHGAVTVNSSELALRAAIDGLGLAFINDTVAEPFLRSGQLVTVLQNWSPSFDGYYLTIPGAGRCLLPLRALIDMLRAQRTRPRPDGPRHDLSRCPGEDVIEARLPRGASRNHRVPPVRLLTESLPSPLATVGGFGMSMPWSTSFCFSSAVVACVLLVQLSGEHGVRNVRRTTVPDSG